MWPVASRAAARDAFTLVELMVVLVVAAILSGAIIPSLVSAARRDGAAEAAAKVTDLLNFASTAAISRRQPVTVNFDLQRRRCWVSVRGFSLPWLEETDQPETMTLAAAELPEGVAISFERDTSAAWESDLEDWGPAVRFDADGTAQDVRIELTDPAGDARTVEVIGVTGEVRLREEE